MKIRANRKSHELKACVWPRNPRNICHDTENKLDCFPRDFITHCQCLLHSIVHTHTHICVLCFVCRPQRCSYTHPHRPSMSYWYRILRSQCLRMFKRFFRCKSWIWGMGTVCLFVWESNLQIYYSNIDISQDKRELTVQSESYRHSSEEQYSGFNIKNISLLIA